MSEQKYMLSIRQTLDSKCLINREEGKWFCYLRTKTGFPHSQKNKSEFQEMPTHFIIRVYTLHGMYMYCISLAEAAEGPKI